MDHDQESGVSTIMYGLAALCLVLALGGCTTWADERQKHYAWLYEKCIRGEHEPYTIHMNRNHDSPLPTRCREEYNHYLGSVSQETEELLKTAADRTSHNRTKM